MRISPPFKSTPLHSHDAIIQRKNSLLKPTPHGIVPQLELPRFYSSDEKLKKKNIIIQTEHHIPVSPQQIASNLQEQPKRAALKYSKTEKNETPSKGDNAKPQMKKILQEKLEEALMQRQQEGPNRPKIRQRRFDYHEILQTQKNEAHASRETTETTAQLNNQNKIRYKGQKKTEAQLKFHKRSSGETVQALEKQPHPKTIREAMRESKVMTQQQLKNPLKQKSKVVLRNEQMTEVVAGQLKKDKKMRTVSTFEAVMKGRNRLTQFQKDHLKTIQDIIRKTIKNPSNLDYPQAYIVCDKLKFEKRYAELIEAKHQTQFRSSLILTRLAFYLSAYYILESMSTKPLVALFSKVLQAHQIISSLLVDSDEKSKNDKYFSINKYSTKDLPRRDSRHLQGSEMAVETRGSTLPRINDSIRRQLSGFFHQKDCIHGELFLRVLNEESSCGSLEDISSIDKELKWEILKMPTSPFLPSPRPAHKHYLILDLDETLIHFNPNKETFHVRPFASEFLQNVSKYYEVTVFTAATKEYADDIINSIDKGGFVSHRLYRNHLTFLMGQSLKDISMLGRHLPSTLIVDNLESNFRLHPNNGILIKSWYGSENDAILPKLQSLLIRIALQFPQDLRKGTSLYANFISREISERVRAFKIKYEV